MSTHPITPPPELLQQWMTAFYGTHVAPSEAGTDLAARAAQWGADCELNACCEWLRSQHHSDTWPSRIRAARRPKPPSLKEQALTALKDMNLSLDDGHNASIIRRALEALPND
jgi:hypothetical protein